MSPLSHQHFSIGLSQLIKEQMGFFEITYEQPLLFLYAILWTAVVRVSECILSSVYYVHRVRGTPQD